MLSAASTMAANGELELVPVMIAGALGAIVGDTTPFWIARSPVQGSRPSRQGVGEPKVRWA